MDEIWEKKGGVIIQDNSTKAHNAMNVDANIVQVNL